jgi:FO synthase subunit 1
MSGIVTYSPAYTLVPTYECFNRCSYCNFRTDPGQSSWLELSDADRVLASLQDRGVIEILILSGEVHPQSRRREAWFRRIYQLCERSLAWGFLPHTNAGPLSFEEMRALKRVNVSMGLMLEQMTPRLLQTVHRHAPSKVPSARSQQLEWAGALGIPFTTGLLLGLGETESERRDTLAEIARIHHKWGHIQEVILQPHSLGSQQSWQGNPFELGQLPETIAMAREILPKAIALQIPPNLVAQPELLLACLEAGASDLGGIGPKDEVNPDYPHPRDRALAEILAPAGWQLVRRLPVYPQYHGWLSPELQVAVARKREREMRG